MSGFLLILFSELGDKTFFIAVLLALKYRSRQGLVFAGSFGALAVMTVISVRGPLPSPPLPRHDVKTRHSTHCTARAYAFRHDRTDVRMCPHEEKLSFLGLHTWDREAPQMVA